MALYFHQIIGVILLALYGVANGWVVPRDIDILDLSISSSDAGVILTEAEVSRRRSLWRRQDSDNCNLDFDDPDTPLCVALCAPSSFSCSSTAIDRRSSVDWRSTFNRSIAAPYDPYAGPGEKPPPRLSKRIFQVINQGNVGQYMARQFNGNFDPYFGLPEALIEIDGGQDTDATLVVQRVFADNDNVPFAVGSAGLHGCTVITVVSRRAVYMGHFWEIPAWASTPQFNKRVLYFFNGAGVREGIGPQLNVDLFNQAGDDTRVYIMHPRRTGSTSAQQSNYRAKVPQLLTVIRAVLGQNVPIALYNYVRLDYENAADRRIANTNQRGLALFQYDPTGRANGAGWRLFYEQHLFQDTDPPPGAASAGGIPD